MSKFRKSIKGELEVINNEVWQDRPYTAVKVLARWGEDEFEAIGFCKVCWPDWWLKSRGEQIARGRALDKIARQIEVEYIAEQTPPLGW